MAGDWVKMRTDLYRDPKVCIIADALMNVEGKLARFVSQHCQRDMTVTRNVMRNVTVGALVTVWGVTRHRGKRDGDGLIVRGATLSVIDDMADLPGFGDAMAAVGWVVETESGLEFPNFFDEYNVDPADELKAKNAERQRKFREKRNAESNVTVALQSNDREEKRREEKREEPAAQARASAVNPSDVLIAWNRCHGLVPAHRVTAKRKTAVAARSRDAAWVENWQAGIVKAAASDFCCGSGSTGWRADVDWFLKPDTLTKILEGKYDNAANGHGQTDIFANLKNYRSGRGESHDGS